MFWGLTGSYGGNYGAPDGFCFDSFCDEAVPVPAVTEGKWTQATFKFDVGNVLEAIEWCTSNPAKAAEMAHRARQHALEAYTDEKVDEQAAAAILRGASKRAGPKRKRKPRAKPFADEL